jgi:uncharacterized OB-fold protein
VTEQQTNEPTEGFMSQMVSLDFVSRTSPVHRRFDEQMREGRIVGHRCPSCGKVYVPPKGFCALCCVVTDASNETEVKDSATVTSFTVITPIQYRGQEEKDEYVLASLLLDGADSTIGQQRISGIPNDQVRMGLKVRAVWNTSDDAKEEGGGMRGWGVGAMVKHWEPSGEPDADPSIFREHVL